jgi:hypothetical protein
MGVHDSLNMILPPGGQECFFEEFAQDSADREIDIFIPQNGNVDIILKVRRTFLSKYTCCCDHFSRVIVMANKLIIIIVVLVVCRYSDP